MAEGENQQIVGSRSSNNGVTMHSQMTEDPNLVLVTNLLTENNYLPWSRSILIALNAKDKLSFIEDNQEVPKIGIEEYKQWKMSDSMVISWLLNAMTKEIAEMFIYASSAKDLWKTIQENYGERNGPQIYQLQREITLIKQGNISVNAYFGKLRKLWDELNCLNPVLRCDCEANKAMEDVLSSNRLI